MHATTIPEKEMLLPWCVCARVHVLWILLLCRKRNLNISREQYIIGIPEIKFYLYYLNSEDHCVCRILIEKKSSVKRESAKRIKKEAQEKKKQKSTSKWKKKKNEIRK